MSAIVAFDNSTTRKARGAFFTPPEIANYMVRWAIRKPTDTVLEPSCGEAVFLLSAVDRLRKLGEEPTASQLHGVDIHADSITTAAAQLQGAATFHIRDFFEFESDIQFDVVIGNPPYVRYQNFIGSARERGLAAARAQGVKLNGLASSWAAFVVHAASFVKNSGRLALVLPAELLAVKYAEPVRQFLVRRFEKVRLVLFEERSFPGVLEEVVLLLAEGEGPSNGLEMLQLRNRQELGLENAPVITHHTSPGKWLSALLPASLNSIYSAVTETPNFDRLIAWGDTSLGMVTGNNNFFALTESRRRELRLDPSEILAICPPGSRHLRGLVFSEKTWKELANSDHRSYLFYPSADLSQGAKAYIDKGESEGVHQGYKCSVRSPWWRVPKVAQAHLFLTYMNHDTPRLIANNVGALFLNSLYGVRLRLGRIRVGMELLPLAFLNTVTMLGAEIVGRSYGGGLLKLEPTEADNLPVPSLNVIQAAEQSLRALRPQIFQLLRNGKVWDAARLVDRVLLRATMHLSQNDIAELRKGHELLAARRSARSRS
jgi:adenine-specific DNA-methyltransferase